MLTDDGAAPVLHVTDFDLRTQKSHDWEAGLRLHFGDVEVQSSYYDMHLTDEIHFSPITFENTDADPTRRQGVETIASWQATRDVRLRGNLTYTDAEFWAGPFSTDIAWCADAGGSGFARSFSALCCRPVDVSKARIGALAGLLPRSLRVILGTLTTTTGGSSVVVELLCPNGWGEHQRTHGRQKRNRLC